MKEYEIKISDLQRIFVGDVPPFFYLEVILRVSLIYMVLMVSMRFMGKRMSSQLSRNEMAAVVSLAAAIGVPLMNPDRGLLPAIVIALVIISFQIFIAKRAAENEKFEALTQDKYDIMVMDGVLNVDSMLKARISRDRIFAQLRFEGISHLGEVKRLYFEAAGSFSVLKAMEERPGLSVLPDWDKEINEALHYKSDIDVCEHCGNQHRQQVAMPAKCDNCGKQKWVRASTLKHV